MARVRLLVSVTNGTEAETALAGGADLIDVKDPANGPLGRPSRAALAEVLSAVAGRAPVSAALGELVEWIGRDPGDFPLPAGLAFVKVGLSACDRRDWKPLLTGLRDRFAQHILAWEPPAWVAVIYADQSWSRSPAPREVLRFAESAGFSGVLLDTWEKNENRLTDWINAEELACLIVQARLADLTIAVAGSLTAADLPALLSGLSEAGTPPDIVGVRGAACQGGARSGPIQAAAVRRLREALER